MRTIKEIKVDMQERIKTAPYDVSYCLQDCSRCNEEMKAWCGIYYLENELRLALAEAESALKGEVDNDE